VTASKVEHRLLRRAYLTCRACGARYAADIEITHTLSRGFVENPHVDPLPQEVAPEDAAHLVHWIMTGGHCTHPPKPEPRQSPQTARRILRIKKKRSNQPKHHPILGV
jgi:hypothetical protein